jgi:hypothetical protein
MEFSRSLHYALQPLECRIFLSANHYSFATLFHYDRPGSTWIYDRQYNNVETQVSGVESLKVNVEAKQVLLDGRLSHLVTETSKTLGASSASYAIDSTGVFMTATDQRAHTSVQLHDLRLAPKLMDFGVTYSNTGTFNGTITLNNNGTTVKAAISGKAFDAIRIVDREMVAVPAGTFAAVMGKYSSKFTGTITFTIDGKITTEPLTIEHDETFWASPSVGEVQTVEQNITTIKTSTQTEQSNHAVILQLKSDSLT